MKAIDPKHCNVSEAGTFKNEDGVITSYIRKILCAKGKRQSTDPKIRHVTTPCDICTRRSCKDCTIEYEVCHYDIPDVNYHGLCTMRILYFKVFDDYEEALKSYEAL